VQTRRGFFGTLGAAIAALAGVKAAEREYVPMDGPTRCPRCGVVAIPYYGGPCRSCGMLHPDDDAGVVGFYDVRRTAYRMPDPTYGGGRVAQWVDARGVRG
jgi:hypothetical protein